MNRSDKQGFRRRRFVLWTSAVLLMVPGCAAPSAEPLADGAVLASLEDRGRLEVLADAWALAPSPPLGLTWEGSPGVADPTQDPYWHGRALAFAAPVRLARRSVRARLAAATAAGWPDPFGLGVATGDLEDPSAGWGFGGSLDLLGLLGLGRAPADAAVAVALAEESGAALETAAWQALFLVDRARVRLALGETRRRLLEQLRDEAQVGADRVRHLHLRGRVGDGRLGQITVALSMLDQDLRQADLRLIQAEETLAVVTGLAPGSLDALKAGGGGSVPLGASPDWWQSLPVRGEVIPESEQLALALARVPALRELRRGFAVAEARVRQAAARAWPALRVGPDFRVMPDQFIPGGMVSLMVPWPGSVAGQVEEALEGRSRAREALEDGLQRTGEAIKARGLELAAQRARWNDETQRFLDGSAQVWRSARGRLQVMESMEVVETWMDALAARRGAVSAWMDTAEGAWIADLTWRESSGVGPGLHGVLEVPVGARP